MWDVRGVAITESVEASFTLPWLDRTSLVVETYLPSHAEAHISNKIPKSYISVFPLCLGYKYLSVQIKVYLHSTGPFTCLSRAAVFEALTDANLLHPTLTSSA